MTRALLTTILIYTVLCCCEMNFPMSHFFIALFFLIVSSLICALIGIISGLLFDNFEEASLITNYFMTPLLFLSGTFYSIKNLPEFFQHLIKVNPFFYMIDGFRYGIIGYSDGSLLFGVIFLTLTACFLWFFAHRILKFGYKIRK
jgi:ABC-2 type transport system permease protein